MESATDNDVFLLTLNRFTPSFSGFVVNIDQVNTCYDVNDNNDDNSHDEDIDRTDFIMNLIFLYFKIGAGG